MRIRFFVVVLILKISFVSLSFCADNGKFKTVNKNNIEDIIKKINQVFLLKNLNFKVTGNTTGGFISDTIPESFIKNKEVDYVGDGFVLSKKLWVEVINVIETILDINHFEKKIDDRLEPSDYQFGVIYKNKNEANLIYFYSDIFENNKINISIGINDSLKDYNNFDSKYFNKLKCEIVRSDVCYYTSKSGVKVKKTPSVNSETLEVLNKHARLELVNDEGAEKIVNGEKWILVYTYQGNIGWCLVKKLVTIKY